MKLEGVLYGLINEIASMDDLTRAIKNRRVLVIYYDGDDPGGKGLREIEPVALGVSLAGNPVLRAWDREGASHRAYLNKKPLPSWRFFRLDKILSQKPTGEIYSIVRPNYNSNGDKSMSKVFITAKFGNTPEGQSLV